MTLIDAHQAVGGRKRQRPQEQGVDRREDGGVRSDTNSQRENDDGGESGMRATLPQRMPEVREQLLERAHGPSPSDRRTRDEFVMRSGNGDEIRIGSRMTN